MIGVLFIAIVFASAIGPWVDQLKKRNVPRILAVVTIYAIVIGLIALIVALLVPIITDQIKQLYNNFPAIYEKIVSGISKAQEGNTSSDIMKTIQNSLSSLNNTLVNITSSVFTGLAGLFGGLFSIVAILVLTFYMTLEENAFKKFVAAVSPAKYQPYLMQLITRIQQRLGWWLRGQLILCAIIGACSFIGLTILGVKYALLLGLIAGLTEFIPIAGPIIGAVPAVLIAFTQTPLKALFVVILYIIIQQLENNLIVPKVMQRATGLNPIVVIIVMLIGAKIAGILGILLAMPVTIIADSFLRDFFHDKKEQERAEEEADEIG